ncbi:MAG: radical SAM family heme chaperone HemW [Parvibaculaceae bacterium]|nr:radical SAM family heme chaperone HemW [Parvibaculaceae bacterium]
MTEPATEFSIKRQRDSFSQSQAGFGIYVHWPFCQSKCPYCDFNSHVMRGVDQTAYATALARELEWMAGESDPKPVTSVFFGGGTPSLMEPKTVEIVLAAIDRLWGLNQGVEISLEANPTSVEANRFRDVAALGVNRLSLGVQAMNDRDLKFLGRLHTSEEALHAIDLARTHFPRLSFDLIYARPGQTEADWEAELVRALSYAVDHLSLYQLTIEEGTPFYDLVSKGAFTIPEEEEAARLYELTQHICTAAGLPAYEISNHAKPGAECRHNLTYWRYGDYVGAGPGAHGRITKDARKWATVTERMPTKWLADVNTHGHAQVEADEIRPETAAEEMLMMGLRLREGVSLERFQSISGRTLNEDRLDFYTSEGLIEQRGGRLVATPRGRLVLNQLLGELLT